MLAFTLFARIAFGQQLGIYQDFVTTFLSVFGQQLGDSALMDMQSKNWFLGTLFYMLMAMIGTSA